MKLYSVETMDDCEIYHDLVVANSKEEAEEKVKSMDWSCLMYCIAEEVNIIGGYKIKLEKVKE